MAIERFYKDLQLTKTTLTVNEYGVEIETTINHTIKGVINQAGSSEIEYAKARNIDVDYKAYVEVTELTKSITKDDRIDGYRVASDPKNTMDRNHHLKILLKEVV